MPRTEKMYSIFNHSLGLSRNLYQLEPNGLLGTVSRFSPSCEPILISMRYLFIGPRRISPFRFYKNMSSSFYPSHALLYGDGGYIFGERGGWIGGKIH